MDEPSPGGGWALPTAIFLGAFAAGVGVYVLTNTNTAAFAHTMFFAALCGFVWRPVIDAGKAVVNQAIQQKENKEAEDLSNKAVDIASSLTNTPPSQLPTKLDELNNATLAAVDALPQVNNMRVKRQIETRINQALRMVSQTAHNDPQGASKLIQSVGETATKNQAPAVANLALSSLGSLAATNAQFRDAHVQLRTNIANTVSSRYLLNQTFRPP
jgi:hypothetical protein